MYNKINFYFFAINKKIEINNLSMYFFKYVCYTLKSTNMGALQAKPEWVDSVDDGQISCEHCSYKTNSDDFLAKHKEKYHDDNCRFVLYMACNGSLEGRNMINNNISAKWIDCTGGQTAYVDGDINVFGQELVEASRRTGVKLYHAYRMHDPGLGLDFPQWWVDAGLMYGVFEKYDLPDDVLVPEDVELEDNELVDE